MIDLLEQCEVDIQTKYHNRIFFCSLNILFILHQTCIAGNRLKNCQIRDVL